MDAAVLLILRGGMGWMNKIKGEGKRGEREGEGGGGERGGGGRGREGGRRRERGKGVGKRGWYAYLCDCVGVGVCVRGGVSWMELLDGWIWRCGCGA